MNRFGRLAALLAIAACLVPAAAFAWPHGLTGVLLQNAGSSSRSAPDGAGGVFVASSKYSYVSASYDVYVQRIDADGNSLWGEPGVLACGAADYQWVEGIASDHAGGCVVVWSDSRDQVTTGVDLYAQRIGASGSVLWPIPNGMSVAVAPGNQWGVRMVVDQSYAYFVWPDGRNVATGQDIYAQTIQLWNGAVTTGSGAAICVVAGEQSSPDLILDTYGYVRMVWSDARSGAYDIYAQSMLWNCLPQWAANGVAVCTATGSQFDPRIAVGSQGRAAVVWSDFRGGSYDIYAQEINDYNGLGYWATNGVPVCTEAGNQMSPRVAADAGGDFVIAWLDQRRGSSMLHDIYAQKLDATGSPVWSYSGAPVRVASGAVTEMSMASDGFGGTYLLWSDSRADASDIYAQRLSSYGGPQWTANGVRVGGGNGSQSTGTFVPVSNGGMRVTWDDYGNSPWGVQHQFVDEWGYTGANPILASVKDVPNDQGSQVKVSWYGSPLDTDPLYRNITDYIVFRSVPTSLAAQLATRARMTAQGPGAGPATIEMAGKRYLRVPSAAQDYFWEELAHVTPRHLSQYSHVAATEGDSVAGSNRKTAFMVMAIAGYGASWWVSKADSGYSVDNLAPAAPAPLTGEYGAGTTALHWDPNAEADLAGYRIYRGASASFTPSLSNRVAAVADTGYVDAASAPYFYKVTAVDTHGNESPVATLLPSGTLAVDGGAARAMFAAPAPNPLRGGAASTLRFALASAGRTKLALYDAQGRVARVLVDGALAAGEHAVTLKGDGLAPGLYLARLESPGFAATRRVLVIE